jgi:hypothetical protein
MIARFSAVLLFFCCECLDETVAVGSLVPRLSYQISHAFRARQVYSIQAASAVSQSHPVNRRDLEAQGINHWWLEQKKKRKGKAKEEEGEYENNIPLDPD